MHETASATNESHVNAVNLLWALTFGLSMSAVYLVLGLLMLVASLPMRNARPYAHLMFQVASYLLFPFGRYVERTYSADTGSIVVDDDEEQQ